MIPSSMDHNLSRIPIPVAPESVGIWSGVTDPVMALGLLLNLYRDRKMRVTVGDVGGFSLSNMRLLLFFYRRDIVGLWVRWFAFPRS
jgi:hypothetical protein